MVDWLRLGADMEDLATQALRTGKQVTGLLRPTVIQPYRGFVADGVANTRARVMEQPIFDVVPGGLRIDATLAANLLRWVVLDIAGLEVTVTIGDQSVTVPGPTRPDRSPLDGTRCTTPHTAKAAR